MKIRWCLFIVMLYSSFVFANEKSCYTVQLISLPKNSISVDRLSRRIHESSCQIMTIGNYITVRCGCFDKYKIAKKHYRKLKKRYKFASIVKSYAYRFKRSANQINAKNMVTTIRRQQAISPSKSCYTIQLWSIPAGYKDKRMSMDYPTNCKKMQIGNHITARCGCFETYNDAKKLFKTLRKNHKKAFITKSYAYRFREDESDESTRKMVTKEELQTYPDSNTSISTAMSEVNFDDNLSYDVFFDQTSEGRKIDDLMIDTPEIEETSDAKIPYKLIKKSRVPLRYEYERYLRPFQGKFYINGVDYRYRFGARVSYDLGYIDEADYSALKYGFRRARVYHRGSFFNQKLFYKTAFSFTGNNHVKDFYIGWQDRIRSKNSRYRIKVGNIKIPQSLEGYTSSKYLTFMERSVSDAYAESRRLGAEICFNKRTKRHYFTLFANYYNSSIDEKLDGDDTDHPTFSTRALYTYKWFPKQLLMAGGSYAVQEYNGDKLRLRSNKESALDPHNYVHVRIRDVDRIEKYHIDALYLHRRFSVQGGYTALNINSKKGPYRFDGYYIQADYFLRGGGKRFDPVYGVFKRLKPGKGGDIEVAGRYSFIDLNDKDEEGGTQSDYTIALNWYVTPHFRFMFNYILALPNTDEYEGLYQVIQSRLLFSF